MMKIIFLCVVLVNIAFFFWEYRKGAPEIYLPPSYENNKGSVNYAQKIMLPSETPETKELVDDANLESEMRAQQLEAPSDTEIANETLLIESKQPVIADTEIVQIPDSKTLTGDDFVEPLYR